jgi:phage FluMu protein Com
MNSMSSTSSGQMVSGANILAHFNVRCPSCNKLFRIDSREIKSASPHFDCTACKARFSFDFPPENVNRIETRLVSQKDTFQLDDSVDHEAIPELRKCPKCSSLNPRLSKECIKCGVIFEKVESLGPEDASLGAIPSLVKAWQELMNDYDNLKKHVAFVDRCEDLHALPYALKKYQSLKEAQPQDDVAQKMFHRILLRNIKSKAETNSVYQRSKLILARVNWVRVRKLAPFGVALFFILVGLSSGMARNMVGVGAAILFLTLGLRVFLKGRLSLEDFW